MLYIKIQNFPAVLQTDARSVGCGVVKFACGISAQTDPESDMHHWNRMCSPLHTLAGMSSGCFVGPTWAAYMKGTELI